MSKYITRYFFFIILGFIVLRLPHGTPMLGRIFDYSIFLGFICSSVIVLSYFPKLNRDSKIVYLFLLALPSFLLISRLLNGFPLTKEAIIRGFMYPVMLISLFCVVLTKDFWYRFKAINYILSIFVSINFLTVIFYPGGWFKSNVYDLNWFLGFKNVMIRTILPALVINEIIAFHEYGKLKIKNYFFYLICLITVTMSQSSTSLVMIILYGLAIIMLPVLRHMKYISLLMAFVIPFIISIGIVLYGLQEDYAAFIEKDLDRDVTFTGRTFIWEYILYKITQSPVIGFGYHPAVEWTDVFFEFDKITISHPHNFVLYSLIQGGFFYFILLIVTILFISRFTWRVRSQNEIVLLLVMYFVFFVGGITESITECPLFLPMFGLFITLKYNLEDEKNWNFYRNRSL